MACGSKKMSWVFDRNDMFSQRQAEFRAGWNFIFDGEMELEMVVSSFCFYI